MSKRMEVVEALAQLFERAGVPMTAANYQAVEKVVDLIVAAARESGR